MGLDMVYQAIPDGCMLLERARFDSVFGQRVGSFIFHNDLQAEIKYLKQQQTVGQKIPQEWIECLEESIRTIQSHPGIETRRLHIGRTWDMLCFLLCAKRRQGDDPHTDLVGRAIVGGDALATKSGQGIPIHYLNPVEVHQVNSMFNAIDRDHLLRNFDPPMMIEAAVYFFPQPEYDEYMLNILWDAFEKVRRFYSVVSAHNEGVLASLW